MFKIETACLPSAEVEQNACIEPALFLMASIPWVKASVLTCLWNSAKPISTVMAAHTFVSPTTYILA